MLVLILGVIALGFICLGIWGGMNRRCAAEGIGWVLGVPLGIGLIVTSIAVPVNNYSRLQEMTAFYYANAKNYGVSVSRTESILSSEKFVEQAFIPIEGSIEKFKFADVIGNRIVEWRDETNDYNTDLQKFRYWDDNIFLGIYYPTVPDELKLLAIQ